MENKHTYNGRHTDGRTERKRYLDGMRDRNRQTDGEIEIDGRADRQKSNCLNASLLIDSRWHPGRDPCGNNVHVTL